MRVKCLAQEYNTLSRPGPEPGPLDPESSALTMRQPRLPLLKQSNLKLVLTANTKAYILQENLIKKIDHNFNLNLILTTTTIENILQERILLNPYYKLQNYPCNIVCSQLEL